MIVQLLQTARVEDDTMSKKRADFGQKGLFPDMRPPKDVFRYLRNYLAGQVVGATRDDALLDELLKCLFGKLHLEMREDSDEHVGDTDSLSLSRQYRSVFQQVRNDFPEVYDSTEEIMLNPENLRHVVQALDFSLLDAKSDPIGDAFEVFAGSESRARSGQFFTPRNATDLLVEAVNPQPTEAIIDPACGAAGFLASVVRHYRMQGRTNDEIADAARRLFGIEKDAYLAKLARLHVSLLSGGHPNIRCGDSLSLTDEAGQPVNGEIGLESFDVVLTNPPFGVKIVAASAKVLEGFSLAHKWKVNRDGQWEATNEIRAKAPPQVLFIERCLSLLRDGGRLGMVVPESLLSNKAYRYVVDYLRQAATLEAVIGMPESLFKTSGKGGTHTKTCLLVATKSKSEAAKGHKVFMAEAMWCGKDSRAREIPKNDLPEIAKRLASHKDNKRYKTGHLGFAVSDKDIYENVLCPRYYDPEISRAVKALEKTHSLLRLGDLLEEGTLSISTGDEVGKLAYGTGDIPFVRTSDISNWEIKADPKHRIERELYESLKNKQDVRPYDLLMVKDGTYLIGTCGIVTEYDCEIVYQSHIYKIRVNENPYGLNPFLLLAILGSSVLRQQIKAKQFTQDIIDSLGERIRELVLPVPRDSATAESVTEMVRKSILDRVEARELARQAREAVLEV